MALGEEHKEMASTLAAVWKTSTFLGGLSAVLEKYVEGNLNNEWVREASLAENLSIPEGTATALTSLCEAVVDYAVERNKNLTLAPAQIRAHVQKFGTAAQKVKSSLEGVANNVMDRRHNWNTFAHELSNITWESITNGVAIALTFGGDAIHLSRRDGRE